MQKRRERTALLLPPNGRQERALLVFLWLCSIAALILLFCLQRMTTYTTDDYYYAAFAGDGTAAFAAKNIAHYRTHNGRVLVHLAAELLLAAGMDVYALAGTALLALVFWTFWRFQNGGRGTGDRLCVPAFVFFVPLLALHYNFLRHSILCVADACNYILPPAVLGLALLLRGKDSRRMLPPACLLFFAAGATTELGGAMTITVLFCLCFCGWYTARQVRKRDLLFVLCTLCGYATIFLSPATRGRVAAEFSLRGVWHGAVQYACNIAAPNRALLLMLVFTVSLSALTLADRRLPRVLLAGLPVGLLLLWGRVGPQSPALCTAVFAVFYGYVLLCGAALILAKTPYLNSGILLLAGGCSVFLMVFTGSSSVRVTVPFLLLLGAAGAYFAGECLSAAPVQPAGIRGAAAVLGAGLLLAAAVRFPVTFSGVRGNYAVLKANEQAVETARQTGILEYTDYDSDYCLIDMFRNPIFDQTFLTYHRLEGVTVLRHTTPVKPIAGTELPVMELNGQLYLPARAPLAVLQAEIRWMSGEYMEFQWDDGGLLYNAPYLYGNGPRIRVSDELISCENTIFFSQKFVEEHFGLELRDDGAAFSLRHA